MNQHANNVCPHANCVGDASNPAVERCLDCGAKLPFPMGLGVMMASFKIPAPETAQEFLNSAEVHMGARATTYDSKGGERSMAKTVALFNQIRGASLTETDGWLMMTLLKIVRANQGGFKSDNFEDLVAYSALMGESAAAENRKKKATA